MSLHAEHEWIARTMMEDVVSLSNPDEDAIIILSEDLSPQDEGPTAAEPEIVIILDDLGVEKVGGISSSTQHEQLIASFDHVTAIPESIVAVSALGGVKRHESLRLAPDDLPPLQIIEIGRIPPPEPVMTVGPQSEPPMMVIGAEEIPSLEPAFRVALEDVIRRTVIRSPVDESQVGRQPLLVAGVAEPGIELVLEIRDQQDEVYFQIDACVDNEGKFAVANLDLHDDWNTIEVWAKEFASVPQCRAFVRVYRQANPLLFVGQEDPYTRRILGPNDDVVRCRRYGHFSLLDSWNSWGGCPWFDCNDRAYWTRNDPHFFEPTKDISI